MNFQNKNVDTQNSKKDSDKLKSINESTIEKPEENYKRAEGEINPTVTFYEEGHPSKIEDIKVIDSEENKYNEQNNVVSERQNNHNNPSKKKKILIYLIFALAVASGFLFYLNSSKKESINKNAQNTIVTIPVVVKKIERKDFKVFEKTIGSISNLDIKSVSSEVNGIVKKVNFDIGDTVKAGEIIAVIDAAETRNKVISSQAEIKRIHALLSDSKKTQSRYNKLIKDGFISQAELDTLNANIRSYQEQLVNAKAILSNDKIVLDKAIIKAPQSGVIQQRYITTGAYVSVSTPIFDIVNNKNLMVIASLPESFSYRLKKNQEVTLKVTGTDIVVFSKIRELKPVIDEQSRSVSLIIDIPENQYNLKPGGTLEVYISMENKKEVVVVPETAVALRVAGKVIYVVSADRKTVSEIPVKTGAYQEGLVEVISGLKGDETIVIDGAGFLSDKASVSISE